MSASVAARESPELHREPALDCDLELDLDLAVARRTALLRVAFVAIAVVAALPWSLRALVADFRYAGALGDLALVPVCALLLGLVAAWRHPWTAALRPGRADWVVAVAALSGAGALLTVGPVVAGNLYYALRPDLLAVPLVAVAAVCLLLGVRALVGLVVPLLLATLTWPLPLRALLEPAAGAATALTSGALRLVLELLPLAAAVDVPGDLRLTVPGPTGAFDVVVASACSGLTGIGGTLLVGTAAQYVLHGSARARVLWLSTAVALAWGLNLVRILLLLAVGRLLGEQVALEVVHPVAGLLLLNASLAFLLFAAPRFGLRLGLASHVPADTPLTDPAPVVQRMDRACLGRRVGALAIAVGLLGTLNTVLPATSGAYDAAGPAVTASVSPVAPPGWATGPAQAQPWSRVYFGPRSDWTRSRLTPTGGRAAPTVWVDSITTDDWAALRAHPLLDCYRFHGFSLSHVSRTVLAAGVLADEVVHRRPDGATWHVLSWEWPVRSTSGVGPMRHERVVLLASSRRTDLAPAPAAADEGGTTPGTGLRALLAARWGTAGTGTDPNPALTAALREVAGDLVTARLGAARGAR